MSSKQKTGRKRAVLEVVKAQACCQSYIQEIANSLYMSLQLLLRSTYPMMAQQFIHLCEEQLLLYIVMVVPHFSPCSVTSALNSELDNLPSFFKLTQNTFMPWTMCCDSWEHTWKHCHFVSTISIYHRPKINNIHRHHLNTFHRSKINIFFPWILLEEARHAQPVSKWIPI